MYLTRTEFFSTDKKLNEKKLDSKIKFDLKDGEATHTKLKA
jgi:hypothetical protein